MEVNIVHNENCLDTMSRMADNSVDSIVTDPPYGLSFMGKKWDYDVPSVAIWKECLRVLKPGGYLLAFAGTRTQHRMCCNIEDAGFEIRDMIAWIYGSGFPKSHNISKAIDKTLGVNPIDVGQSPNWRESKRDREKDGKMEVRGENAGRITEPNSDEAKQYEGWGTALKPALEPITVARKPLSEKTVAANVLKWGTGGINIDGCRVPLDVDYKCAANGRPSQTGLGDNYNSDKANNHIEQGRFPANLIHDGSQMVLDLFPDSKGQQGNVKGNEPSSFTADISGKFNDRLPSEKRNDSGSAARFFYCAKASKADRNEGLENLEDKQYSHDGRNKEIENAYQRNKSVAKNNHPTVKPTKLMRYLVRLVTPVGGIVYDPFSGSGSTGKACKPEGFDFVGSEMEESYCEIANKRILG